MLIRTIFILFIYNEKMSFSRLFHFLLQLLVRGSVRSGNTSDIEMALELTGKKRVPSPLNAISAIFTVPSSIYCEELSK